MATLHRIGIRMRKQNEIPNTYKIPSNQETKRSESMHPRVQGSSVQSSGIQVYKEWLCRVQSFRVQESRIDALRRLEPKRPYCASRVQLF